MAAPAPVLRLTSSAGSLDLPLALDGGYTSGYRQSIYGVPVLETERAVAGRIAIVRARSTDRRSLEYYRWGDDIREIGGAYEQDAPANGVDALSIRVTAGGEQWIESDGVRIDLLARFGETAIRVVPATTPALAWLLAHLAR